MSLNILMVVFKRVFNFFIHLPYQTIKDHTVVSHTVTHNFSLLISFHMSNNVTNSFLFAPVKAIAHKFLLVIDWDVIWT